MTPFCYKKKELKHKDAIKGQILQSRPNFHCFQSESLKIYKLKANLNRYVRFCS